MANHVRLSHAPCGLCGQKDGHIMKGRQSPYRGSLDNFWHVMTLSERDRYEASSHAPGCGECKNKLHLRDLRRRRDRAGTGTIALKAILPVEGPPEAFVLGVWPVREMTVDEIREKYGIPDAQS